MDKLNSLPLSNDEKERIRSWIENPYIDDRLKKEILELIEREEVDKLKDRFYRVLEFGTGGLRGIMEAGINRMNEYTVSLATQGLVNYVKRFTKDGSASISFDTRHNSKFFAEITASVFAGNGLPVYVYTEPKPTPLLSFTIRDLKTTSGVMITASHNPPEYNGYKVYWEDGAQIVAPHDKNIVAEVKSIKGIEEVKRIDYKEGVERGLIKEIGTEVEDRYMDAILDIPNRRSDLKKYLDDIKVVYTPLHGTGSKVFPKLLDRAGIKGFIGVESQMVMDGGFPTVEYPNPEDRAALELGIKKLTESDADILIATDPDADRMGIVVNEDGKIHILNGNQIGSLLGYYMAMLYKETGALGELPGYMVKSIVTTDLISYIAKDFGFEIEEVLTGFKYIGEKIRLYEGKKKFIFGAEESYGYLVGDYVRDKDGISAGLFIIEVLAYARSIGKGLYSLLVDMYKKYGYFYEELINVKYEGLEVMEKMGNIMSFLRNNPPKEIGGISVVRIWDIKEGKEIDLKDNTEKENKSLPSSNVLVFYLEDETKVVARPSGTEPKIKYYFLLKGNVENEDEVLNRAFNIKNDFLNITNNASS